MCKSPGWPPWILTSRRLLGFTLNNLRGLGRCERQGGQCPKVAASNGRSNCVQGPGGHALHPTSVASGIQEPLHHSPEV